MAVSILSGEDHKPLLWALAPHRKHMKVDTEKVVKHLVETWGENRKCPMCGSGHWTVSEMIVELREFHQGTLMAGGNLFPVIPITCSNCATSQFVNAVQIGLIDEGGSNE